MNNNALYYSLYLDDNGPLINALNDDAALQFNYSILLFQFLNASN